MVGLPLKNGLSQIEFMPALTHHKDPTISLCMIVKNEATVIDRCINSVKHLIDSWLIVDTGSSDGTQNIIKNALKDVPGSLLERTWVDFSHNRNQAIEAAREQADFLLFIDADEVLVTPSDFHWPQMEMDAYTFLVDFENHTYLRRSLVSTKKPWRYTGVIHEYTVCDEPVKEGLWSHLKIIPHTDGARRRNANTYKEDVKLIESALISEPDKARYTYYLGQSYRDADMLEESLDAYTRRATMQGYPDEDWSALYNIAFIKEQLDHTRSEVQLAYLECYEQSPDRAEPLYRLSLLLRKHGQVHQPLLFLQAALTITRPQPHRLFVENNVYHHLMHVEYAALCMQLHRYPETIKTCNDLLLSDLPAGLINQVRSSRRYALEATKQPLTSPPAPVFHVIVNCNDGADTCYLDDLIYSILTQTTVSTELHLFCTSDTHYADELSDHTVQLHQRDQSWSLLDCLSLLAEKADLKENLVCTFAENSYLAHTQALQHLWHLFAEDNIMLAYGQTEHSQGKPGRAMPAHDHTLHNKLQAELADAGALVLRGSFIANLITEYGSKAGFSRNQLFEAANFEGTRFTEDVICRVRSLAGPTKDSTATVNDSNTPTQPLISCLMVTGSRLLFAKRAINSFLHQSYPRKQLVIVCDGPLLVRSALTRYCNSVAPDLCKLILLEPANASLGELRNLSIEHADGDIICQWDDDDLSHPERLQQQSRALITSGDAACLLNDHLHYLADVHTIVWVDWTLAGQPGPDQVHPGTIMLWRKFAPHYPSSGASAKQGEDTEFLMQLCANQSITQLQGHGYLFLYTYHGSNTFDRNHHYRISSFARSSETVQKHKHLLHTAINTYPISKPLQIAGREGPVFSIA